MEDFFDDNEINWCPSCGGTEGKYEITWRCTCGKDNSLEHNNCSDCGNIPQETQCPYCIVTSPHIDWYPHLNHWLRDELEEVEKWRAVRKYFKKWRLGNSHRQTMVYQKPEPNIEKFPYMLRYHPNQRYRWIFRIPPLKN